LGAGIRGSQGGGHDRNAGPGDGRVTYRMAQRHVCIMQELHLSARKGWAGALGR
jgi:hypothetical protein